MGELRILDLHPEAEDFKKSILSGLSSRPKALPSKYLYDERGSELFDLICQQPEYYQTRSEVSILEANIDEICRCFGKSLHLIEYGSGHSRKIRVLIEGLKEKLHYSPLDISKEYLIETAEILHRDYPAMDITAVCADMLNGQSIINALSDVAPNQKRVVFFPGSTVGNFEPPTADSIMESTAALVGKGGGFLVGIDLRKDPAVIEAAYNDAAGATRTFELNYFSRLNRELNANFDVSQWEYRGKYLPDYGRVQMEAVSLIDQTVRIGEKEISIQKDEPIHLENSYKFTVEDFSERAARFGLQLKEHWTDEKQWFGVLYFEVA